MLCAIFSMNIWDNIFLKIVKNESFKMKAFKYILFYLITMAFLFFPLYMYFFIWLIFIMQITQYKHLLERLRFSHCYCLFVFSLFVSLYVLIY